MATQLSAHFSLEEMTKSGTAKRLGIDNTPNALQIQNLRTLCQNVLETIRLYYNAPVIVSSGFRCPALNKAQGGAATSQHLLGEAADIEVLGVSNADVWRFIKSINNFDQLVAEHLRKDDGEAGWIHVSFRPGRLRKEAISCIGKDLYVPGLQYAA